MSWADEEYDNRKIINIMIKRTLILTLLVFVHCLSNAQKLNYALEAGYTYNHLSVSQYNSSGRNGFKVGGLIDFTINNNLSFESGLSYIRKGGSTYGNYLLCSDISRIKFSSMDYLQIPLMIGYIFNLPQKFSIKAELGAYYAVGLSGDSYITGIDNFGQPYEARVSTFSDGYGKPYRPCNRNDVGLSFSVNISYKHVGIKLGYDMGLTNATYYGNGKHRTLSMSAIYWIKQ